MTVSAASCMIEHVNRIYAALLTFSKQSWSAAGRRQRACYDAAWHEFLQAASGQMAGPTAPVIAGSNVEVSIKTMG